MTTLVDDKKSNSGIDSFLAGYTEDMTIINRSSSPGQTANPALSNPVITTIESMKEQWQGNAKYYQTGKKAGQLKASVGNTTVKPAGQYQQGTPLPNTPANQTGTVQNTLITGALFLIIVDVAIPFAIASINNWLSKDKIDSAKLQLTEKQRKDLEPLADAVVKYLNLNANPVVLFLIGYGGIVTMNLMLQRSIAKSKPVEK